MWREAVARLVDEGEASGTTYELGGPEVFTFKQLMQFTLDTIGRSRLLVPAALGHGQAAGRRSWACCPSRC